MALQNKLFTSNTIPESGQVSKIRANREYLLTEATGYDLNTYLNFGSFSSFNDVFKEYYEKDKNNHYKRTNIQIGTPGVRSLFNRAGAVLVGSSDGNLPNREQLINNPSEIRISNNVPLIDTPETRAKIKQNSGCSIKELVQASSTGVLGKAIYSYADFMYCKHLGKVPNNHLITLRRFPVPIGDCITASGEGQSRLKEGKNNGPQQIGCMVSWLGVSGNEMTNILKYNYRMPFDERTAKWEDIQGSADSDGKLLNSVAAVFDDKYRQQYMQGFGGSDLGPINSYIGKYYKSGGDLFPTGRYGTNDFLIKDDNKIYGPVDRVKSTYMRSEDGLKFDQSITLVFEYELRSYNGINGRQAMLDLISNILNVTYSTGDFWGGGYKSAGMHQNSLYSNMKIFKAKGGVSDFIDAFAQDLSTIGDATRAALNGKNIWELSKSILNQLGGMILGGMLNKLGRPAKIYANSLLSEQPVGFWHVMIGNPHHPIMSMGNMILTDTTIEHYGPLGLDDFPTNLKVTCTLTRGKPRDIREIEKMYMHGNDRIYHGMGPKVFDMYKTAQEYQGGQSKFKTYSYSESNGGELNTGQSNVNGRNITEVTGMSEGDLKNIGGILKKYFGETDSYSIYVAAAEQEYGSQKRKKTGENESSSFKPSQATKY